jgi:hypothetical protein
VVLGTERLVEGALRITALVVNDFWRGNLS